VLNKAYAYVIAPPPPPQSLVRRFLTIHVRKTREVNPPSKLMPGNQLRLVILENYYYFFILFLEVIRWESCFKHEKLKRTAELPKNIVILGNIVLLDGKYVLSFFSFTRTV
jgi:hypothetical protein